MYHDGSISAENGSIEGLTSLDIKITVMYVTIFHSCHAAAPKGLVIN